MRDDAGRFSREIIHSQRIVIYGMIISISYESISLSAAEPPVVSLA